MRILDVDLAPGQKKRIVLDIHGGLKLPVWLAIGQNPGPRLVVAAGVHGCEYVGVLAAKTLYDQIETSELCGALVILPLINSSGFFHGLKQFVREDGLNLNRVFPGEPDGSASHRLAKVIEKRIYPLADFLIDLHGGDSNEEMEPLVFFSKAAGDEITQKSREAASYLEVEYRVPSTSKNGLYSYAAQCGIPGMLLEIGGRGGWTEQEVQKCLKSLYSLMGHLNLMGQGRKNLNQKEALESVYESAVENGLWYPRMKAGRPFKKGELLGALEDLEGHVLQRVEAKFDGVVLYFTTSLGVRQGEPLAAYGRFQPDAEPLYG
jgi:predicted deacylase